ncbi:haloacid dehalogenase type II [Paenalkalicoccus suaedae]|uniref:Haloacid dehalogenase type II n=1 Tax=Paenalkalicoccus suaedae TaxID=2592382 RepID=A0A859FAS5_9BACI|nr:haloacid dehalogenase type II [Paenalkalicoccus suaedae]QKS70040.1 haloacid dehalogenase type II [Paenalkalicoccus suaedae]
MKVLIMDVFGTLFDVTQVAETLERHFPGNGEEISQLWRQKQIDYAFRRQITGDYKSFEHVTREALQHSLLSYDLHVKEDTLDELASAYNTLPLFPEVKEVLTKLSSKPKALLSNGTPSMLESLLYQEKIQDEFSHVLSVDRIKQYKPAPSTYLYALQELKVSREDVLFVSTNPWDIIGAKTFGFQTLWINRSEATFDVADYKPDFESEDLTILLKEF